MSTRPFAHFRMRTRTRLAILLTLWGVSCDRTRSSAVREWTAEDHDQEQTPSRGPIASTVGAPASAAASGNPELVEVAWEKNCLLCHGPAGRGDGPQAAMLRVPDLTRADWQDRVTDDQILETIRRGRNKMPAFDLPRSVLEGLVTRIRARRQK